MAALALASIACNVDAGGHFESLSGGTYGPDSGGGDVLEEDDGEAGGADETGENPFPPDAEACVFDGAGTACSTAADCCMTEQPPAFLVPGACPSAAFPNNWSCNGSNQCVHESGSGNDGCDEHSDCSSILEGYVCVIVAGNGRCAPGCASTADCLEKVDGHGLPPGFTCETATGTPLGTVEYCRQLAD